LKNGDFFIFIYFLFLFFCMDMEVWANQMFVGYPILQNIIFFVQRKKEIKTWG